MSILLALALTADTPGLYQRVEQLLASDPALSARIGQPAAEMQEVGWMIGTWDVFAIVEGGDAPAERGTSIVSPLFEGTWLEIRDSYPTGTQDIGYLGYNPAQRRWISVALDSLANANRTYAEGWDRGHATFEGDVVIVGVPAHLRQTIERRSSDEYVVTNEELVDGSWRRLDRYRYVRRPTR